MTNRKGEGKMNVTFSQVANPKEIRQALWEYYSYYCGLSPAKTILELLLDFGIAAAGVLFGWGLMVLVGLVGLVFVLARTLGFFAYWVKMKRFLSMEKAFEIPAEYRLTDDWFEMERGNNKIRRDYHQISTFFVKNDTVMLMTAKLLVGIFSRKNFPGEFDEFLGHLKRCGAVDKTPRGVRRWLLPAILAVIAAILYGSILLRIFTECACD